LENAILPDPTKKTPNAPATSQNIEKSPPGTAPNMMQ